MRSIQEIVAKMSGAPREGIALVEKAYTFAEDAHKDHKRFSGDPYFDHLSETAYLLADIGMSSKTIAAGLLHDSIEDVGIAPETIEREFGKEILFLVEGVTKLGRLKYRGAERHRESLRKLLVATGKDARVLIIKLMDRLHNMRTLAHVPEEKRKRIGLETLEIYASIAHRLGMGLVRRELEDLSFEHVLPNEYRDTKKLLSERSKATLDRLQKMTNTLRKEFAQNSIKNFQTDSRIKGLYSLYRKLQRKDGDIEKIYDIAALRIMVPTVEDCYRVLGLVNNIYQPLPNKIKDYIAFPKPNGYKSLHTTVFSGDGGIVEVQIRTPEMHEEAERGIAAHVEYKEEDAKTGSRGGSFDWVKSLIPGFGRKSNTPQTRYSPSSAPSWLSDLGDAEEDPELETSIKTDIFSRRVFVFTPTGDVVDLPAESSPVDFAYAIHSDIGDRVFGAKVNGKMVPLDTHLHNGDIVEIQTKKTAKPKSKWLDFAKTTLARRHIRQAIEKEKDFR
ncbi:bifunctional (p)ppGpp synthetase/guanosine-3',5'-bis(diphosphate) 3'-pyrophosphohydrolase [Candidatus Nomurabacteria bacterium]|nr:bifunctional (p)ppGpp synthetase/guanosine-3',5'-bis(diphosphate) 3'-pyrophosphohydrolase [Candidatus Nomurabacteria bacterium]